MRAKSRKGASTVVTAVVANRPEPLSAARVAAPSREEIAQKTRFRIAKVSINRYWVNGHQSRFRQVSSKIPFKLRVVLKATQSLCGGACDGFRHEKRDDQTEQKQNKFESRSRFSPSQSKRQNSARRRKPTRRWPKRPRAKLAGCRILSR
jgi:hypothetical protein